MGIPVVGPGARPYKRSHLFSLLAEQICAYVENPTPRLLRQTEKELFFLTLSITGREQNIFSYKGRITVLSLLYAAMEIKGSNPDAIGWLRSASSRFEDILCRDGFLNKSSAGILSQSAEDMIADIRKQKANQLHLTTHDLGLYANPDNSIKLLTMHRAKGREFDAVAIVDLHERRIPHSSAKSECEIDEGRRLLYVAITRPRRILMYFTDYSDYRNRPSRFLGPGELGII